MKLSKKTLAIAEKYARLEPEREYPDCAAAIKLAKALLRAQVKTGPARVSRQRVASTPTLTTTQRALLVLSAVGSEGLSADDLGGKLWPIREGRVTSSGGGGDYAAQMMLGRLRKQGLARTQHTQGSSIWEVTPLGMAKADIIRIAITKGELKP